LITILSLMAAALMLTIVKAFAANAAAQGSAITIAESVRLCVSSVLVFLVMRQVMPIAAGLASGIALSSFGAVSGMLRWGLNTGKHSLYDFGRGTIDGLRHEPISRWDSLRRGAGNLAGRGLASGYGHLTNSRIGGAVRLDDSGRPVVPREVLMPKRRWN
jgi:type IV secretion system protein VirB6